MLAFQPGTGPHIKLDTPTYCGLSLSPATESFPRKLEEKVRSGQFVEMHELLRDNISLLGQLKTLGGQSNTILPGASRPRLRETSSIASWMYSFLAYVAIRSSEESTRDMLAYGRLISREAQRHVGQGWLDYDRIFRQQAAIDHNLKWNSIHPSIKAATLVNNSETSGSFCTLCHEADHSAKSFAMNFLQVPVSQ